ncbi:ATP-grasp domain-containing protein [Flavobacterium sp. UBA4197]|uniref:ATP-grasp domain-containing protein n=1 Tax=Flavobacterium sp. UBA4197 TaxID=1946546 RepID=UPI00257A125E|nr:hypothetical protein [Flavobacterium sp. UBA4197]
MLTIKEDNMKIAYVCYEIQQRYITADVADEDTLLLHYLQEKGLDITREIWTDSKVNWADYKTVILKAPWDYHDKIREFTAWLDRLHNLGIQILNPYTVVKWNSDKHYLNDIAAAGLGVIPSLFIEKGEKPDFEMFFRHFNSDKIIFKPCISAGAKNTMVITPENCASIQKDGHALLAAEAFIAQPFMKEIQTEGEWSFLFFNGKYSHCIVKKPKSGDFRIQHYYGGTIHDEAIDKQYIETAQLYVDKFAKGCLYARVDGIIANGTFLLMELELIEPFLFLEKHPEGLALYYEALMALL